jgi:hypothetical protein
MCEEQILDSGHTLIEEIYIYDNHVARLKTAIEQATSVSVLRKIWNSGMHRKEVFKRLKELGGMNDTDALLAVIEITSSSKKKKGATKNRHGWSMNGQKQS